MLSNLEYNVRDKLLVNQAIDSFPKTINGNDEFCLEPGKKDGKYVIYLYFFNQNLKNHLPKIWEEFELIPIYQEINFCPTDTIL